MWARLAGRLLTKTGRCETTAATQTEDPLDTALREQMLASATEVVNELCTFCSGSANGGFRHARRARAGGRPRADGDLVEPGGRRGRVTHSGMPPVRCPFVAGDAPTAQAAH